MNGSAMWGTTVDVIAWGLPHKATTNSSGYFQINTRIHVGTIVYLSFENSNCNIKLWNLETWYNINNITLTALYYVGARTSNNISGMNIALDNQSHGGFCAVITDGVERYRQRASQMGIGVPPKVYITAIWGKNFKLGSGSAPMAHYMSTTPGFVPNLLQPLLQTGIDLALPFAKLLPDIIIPAQKGFNKNGILATTLHEYTHAAHAHLAGAVFWTKVVAGEILNMINTGDPYGYRSTSGTGPIVVIPGVPSTTPGGSSVSPEEVGVAEAWAECIEYYMMYLITGDAAYINAIENRYYNSASATALGNWVPSGLYFDLWDLNGSTYGTTTVYEETKYNIMDEVSGISWSSMYYNLFGTYDFSTYKAKLILLYPTQKQQIIDLFDSYSY